MGHSGPGCISLGNSTVEGAVGEELGAERNRFVEGEGDEVLVVLVRLFAGIAAGRRDDSDEVAAEVNPRDLVAAIGVGGQAHLGWVMTGQLDDGPDDRLVFVIAEQTGEPGVGLDHLIGAEYEHRVGQVGDRSGSVGNGRG